MREFAKVSPQIWTSDLGRKIKHLGIEARAVSLYLLTGSTAHMTGVYYIPVVLIAHEAGLSVEQATIVINNLCEIGYCSYDYQCEYVWVHDMGITQVSAQLKANDNRIKAINNHYASLPKLSFLQDFYKKYAALFFLNSSHEFINPFQAPSNTLRSNKNDNDKENDNENKNEKETILSGTPDIDYEKLSISFEKNQQHEKKKHSTAYLSQATDILNFLNEKTKCRFRLEEINLRLIIARHGADMQKYLRPATLFNPVKFEQYLGENCNVWRR